LEDLDDEVDINSAWETIRQNIKISGKESPGYLKLKKHKPWFDKGCSELLDQRKQAKCRLYKTTILLVVLYGCETWFLTLREEHRLGVFENRVLRRIFRRSSNKATGGWRTLHNGQVKEDKMDMACSMNGEKKNAYRLLV
jgi:hypothetical protein